MRPGPSRSASISANAVDLASGHLEREGTGDPFAQVAIALHDAAFLGAQAVAHEDEGELVGEQFIVGEALPGTAAG